MGLRGEGMTREPTPGRQVFGRGRIGGDETEDLSRMEGGQAQA